MAMSKLSNTFGMRVFTDEGDYFGEVEDAVVSASKIVSWKVQSGSNSILQKLVKNAKGVIVPHQLVKSIGDIMIISNAALPKSN
ncbi:PRC-barrel domain-containing protein [Candidatus Woesearchaeota archaeon]|nr:PRC-barrel domain-containing protein [Candidatus Woesearchaeota archaeon]